MVLKLILLGEPSVGKTSLRSKFFGFGFKSQYMMTIGAEFSIMDIVSTNEEGISSHTKSQVWDLHPHKRFKESRPLYYSGTHIVILVYDITNPQSLEKLTIWIKESQEHTGIIPIILIGNKVDLRQSDNNFITTKMGLEFASRLKKEFLNDMYEVSFVETSAVTGEIHPPGVEVEIINVNNEKITFSLFN